jgi:hypothetical protein
MDSVGLVGKAFQKFSWGFDDLGTEAWCFVSAFTSSSMHDE